MEASQSKLVDLMQGKKQFKIPIYQRQYDWSEEECAQLIEDILHITDNHYFLGSIVYVNDNKFRPTGVNELSVIDGQQRLTTITLLFIAIIYLIKNKKITSSINIDDIRETYLINRYDLDAKYKLVLNSNDADVLKNILEDIISNVDKSSRVWKNLNYIQSHIIQSKINVDDLYAKIGKLQIVSIRLDPPNDRPQPIFESLNSTGLALSASDQIRNYILMDLEESKQVTLYNKYWLPIMQELKQNNARSVKDFDDFIRMYLTMKNFEPPNNNDLYRKFKDHIGKNIDDKLLFQEISDMYKFSKYYTLLKHATTTNNKLKTHIENLNILRATTVFPFLMLVLDYSKCNIISNEDMLQVFSIVECYILRRNVCGLSGAGYNRLFGSLCREVGKTDTVKRLGALLLKKNLESRFPDDKEFEDRFKTFLNTDHKKTTYILKTIEIGNNTKEQSLPNNISLEHIMPKKLDGQWKKDLGSNWEKTHFTLLENIGNLTLTGYNSEYGNRSYHIKKTIENGLASSKLFLNHKFKDIVKWDNDEIERHAKMLSELAVSAWPIPNISMNEIKNILNEDDEEYEESIDENQTWESRQNNMTMDNMELLDKLFTKLSTKLEYTKEPHNGYLYLYISRPIIPTKLFAVIRSNIATSRIRYMISPNMSDDLNVRKTKNWFFNKKNYEGSMLLTNESFDYLISLLEISYELAEKYTG